MFLGFVDGPKYHREAPSEVRIFLGTSLRVSLISRVCVDFVLFFGRAMFKRDAFAG